MPDILHTSLALGFALVGIACLLVASLHDIVARTAPDWAAVVLLASGLALRLIYGNLLPGLAIGLLVFVLAAVCWRLGWMGGGDVKLLAAASVFVPPGQALPFILAVTLSGGVLALLYLVAQRFVAPPSSVRPHTLWGRALRAERWRIRRGGPLPYACAIAVGGLLVLL